VTHRQPDATERPDAEASAQPSPAADGPAELRADALGSTQTALVAGGLLAVSGALLFAAGLGLGGAGAGRDAEEQAAVEAFSETYRQITREFVGEAPPDELLEGAIRGMFETLDDPYSAYLGPDEFETTLADISGEFEGIGARMSVEDSGGASCPAIEDDCGLRVVEVLPEAPALAAGLLAGDVVTAVDGQGLEGRTLEDAVAIIRGPRDSDVRLTIDRDGETLDLSVRRGVISSQDVRWAVLEDGKIGYLRIDTFSGGAADDFEVALGELLEDELTGVVLDVRGDPGGFVDAAVDIAGQFIADGPVYWEEDAAGRQRAVEAAGDGLAVDPALEVVVLVDDGTASASEILAGALQDAGRAVLVGQPTFGKGTVQEWSQLPGESGGYRLSVAKWLTRDKTWVHEVGLAPDVEVSGGGERFWPTLGDEGVDAAAVAADPQLQRAISILLGEPTPASPTDGTPGSPAASPGSPAASPGGPPGTEAPG
jgi:carboxyl-terminal processing protease